MLRPNNGSLEIWAVDGVRHQSPLLGTLDIAEYIKINFWENRKAATTNGQTQKHNTENL